MKRSSARGFLGLHLVAGIIVFATMTLTLGEISEDIINREPLTVVDAQLSSWLHLHGSPLMTSTMLAVTFFGATATVSCIAIVFGVYFIRRRRFYWLAALVSSVFGGILLNRVLKFVFQRPRPHFDDPILSLTSYGFPSGHTMAATVLYGVIATYFFTTSLDWRRRLLVIFAASLLILLIAFSRMYLGAHYLSDVLGAMAEGLAWLALCLTVAYSVWRQRVARR
jgi:membrane-associated phospholipid phosphatase